MKTGYKLSTGIKGHTEWRKALWTDPELNDRFRSDRRVKWDTRMTAEVISLFGNNGRGCFPSAAVVSQRLGCNRDVVERHRKWLVGRGWFVEMRPHKRTTVLDIALPDDVGHEWKTGVRSWAGPAAGVFSADLTKTKIGVVVPDRPVDVYAAWETSKGSSPF